jgi:hypothetical protein
MAFLYQDQNQGTRNEKARAGLALASRPFSFIRTLTVGFGIAPNLLTLLLHARFPELGEEGARGLEPLGESRPFTAGGELHPALRTSAVRDGRPAKTMAKPRPPGKRLWPCEAWGTGIAPMLQALTARRKIAAGKSPRRKS